MSRILREMGRRTGAELREAKERQRERGEKEAWRHYVRGLSQIDDPVAAQRFADQGEPGGRLYHNLGCFLYGPVHTPDRPSPDEWQEFLKFVQRAEAAGKKPAGSAVWFEQQMKEWQNEQKRKPGF